MAILGIDEVGRGSIAGPLVVGAVVLTAEIAGLNDSKVLTKKRRAELSATILESGAGVGLGWVSAAEIDEIGISQALKLATFRAVKEAQKTKVPFGEIIIDGTINFLSGTALEKYVTTLIKADQKIAAVSAASIVAKVARDRHLTEALAPKYPAYGFEKHVGYGTKYHFQMIEQHGVCAEHRLSIQPLQKYNPHAISSVPPAKNVVKNTTKIGNRAEEKVAKMLEDEGHEIIARNFKNRFAETDIISKYHSKYYFTEVKYRKNPDRGSGLEAITPAKLHKMQLGVELFGHQFHIENFNPILSVASVEGEDYEITEFLTLDESHCKC